MALIFPGDKLLGSMSREDVIELGHDLVGLIEDKEREAAPLHRAIAVWWKWYEAEPKTKEKNFPFKNAANVVVPMIGITCDALSSRSLAQATAAAPTYWMTRTENENNVQTARNMARYINWQADGNCFSLKHVLAGQLLETYVTGRSACALHYRREVKPMFFGRSGGRRSQLRRVPMTIQRGPLVEHVPHEHLLWDTRVRIGDSSYVIRKHEWTWVQLREMQKQDDAWDQTAVEEIRGKGGLDASDAQRIQSVKDDLDLRDRDPLDAELHDVRECWIDWSMLGSRFEVPGEEEWGGEQVPLLAHLHVRTGRILRLVGMPYLLPYKPFVDFKFRGGRGVAKRLEMLQSIQTTVWNQALDARTRANAVWAITRNARHLKTPLDPSRPILVEDMGELAPFALPSSPQQDLPLLVAAQTMAERWMGQSDPLLGRDTRSGGHPAPATSTLALLEQVNVMSAGTDVILQEELSRLGEAIAILDQQFEDPSDNRLVQILGQSDAQSAGLYLFPEEPIPGNYSFDVAALSQTSNPDVEQRRTLMTAQAYQNFGNLSVQGMMVIDSPQASPRLKAVWLKLLEGYGKLMQDFLDASNVDDSEKFLINMQEMGLNARAGFQQFTQQAQQLAAGPPGGGGGGAVAASGSLVGAPNGAGNGAGVPFTGGGNLFG